jgi:retron-type reverse transcriptase
MLTKLTKENLIKIYRTFNSVQAVGIDGTSKEVFDKNINTEIDIIIRKVSNETYDFSYYKQKLLVKSTDKTREISIPTLRDKLLLKYLSIYLVNTFFNNKSLINIASMIKDIKKYKCDYKYFVKTDVKTFFSTIDHKILFEKLAKKIKDQSTLNLIKKAITQTTVNIKSSSKERIKYNNFVGVPEGLSISGLLADIYLQDLDSKYQNNKNIKYFRFLDDILILSNHKNIYSFTKHLIKNFEKLKLCIHDFKQDSNKSSYGHISNRFEFLGYRFNENSISVRDSSIRKLYENLNTLFTLYKFKSITKNQLYIKLNYKIVGCTIEGKRYGWLNFFNQINDYKLLYTIDNFIEKMSSKYNLDYTKIKKFSRAICEMKDPQSKYLKVKSNTIVNEIKCQLKSNTTVNEIKCQLKNDVEFY